MPLGNFGSILAFAAELEEADQAFYAGLAAAPGLAGLAGVFTRLAADAAKNHAEVLRARRENVTEMILEPIAGFTRAPFLRQRGDGAGLDRGQALTAAREAEEKAAQFYRQAAAKLMAMPELARALKNLAKKRQKHLEELAGL